MKTLLRTPDIVSVGAGPGLTGNYPQLIIKKHAGMRTAGGKSCISCDLGPV